MNNHAASSNIWIVDSNSEIVNPLADLLRHSGYEIELMQSGLEAIRAIQKCIATNDLPSLILLEASLSDMSGFEVCRQIKALPRGVDIPVIFVSNNDEIDYKICGYDVGAIDYIVKPFNIHEVQARISRHLSLHYRYQQVMAQNQSLENELQERTNQLAIAAESCRLNAREAKRLRQERAQLINLAGKQRGAGSDANTSSMLHSLSEREKEILRLIAQSKDNKEIAAVVCVTESTVRSYRSRLATKLSTKNSYELFRVALQHFGH